MNKNIIVCGVGGQGTVLATKLIAATAMNKGLDVMSAETIGMAQRGGSVFSHIRIGEELYTPMLSEKSADLIIAFEPVEAVRMLPFLKEGGAVIVSKKAVKPVILDKTQDYSEEDMIAYLGTVTPNVVTIDAASALRDIGSPKVLNVLLLGAAATSGLLGFTTEELEAAILARVKPKFHELNIKTLHYFEEK